MSIKATWVPPPQYHSEGLELISRALRARFINRVKLLSRKLLKKRKALFKEAKELGFKEGLNESKELLRLLSNLKDSQENSVRTSAISLINEALGEIIQEALPLPEIFEKKIESILLKFPIKQNISIISKETLPFDIIPNQLTDSSLEPDEIILRHDSGQIRYSFRMEFLKLIRESNNS